MLSEVQTDGSAVPGPPPLGRLLITYGFLTEEQLQVGLAEHGRTGLPPGPGSIRPRFGAKAGNRPVPPPAGGGPFKTCSGFATVCASAEPAAPPLHVAGLRTAETGPQPVEPAPQAQADII